MDRGGRGGGGFWGGGLEDLGGYCLNFSYFLLVEFFLKDRVLELEEMYNQGKLLDPMK